MANVEERTDLCRIRGVERERKRKAAERGD